MTLLSTTMTVIQVKPLRKRAEQGQVTLLHLLSCIQFFSPVCAVIMELKHHGSGALAYLVAVPLALALGALIVALCWTIGKTVWDRCQRHSKLQSAVAFGLFVFQLLAILVADASGFKLAEVVAKHVTR
jgi:hypothetical protein